MNTPHDNPMFHWAADSSAADTPSGMATFTYREPYTDRIVTITTRFESFMAAHRIANMLLATYEAGCEKGFAECKAKVLALTGGPP